MDEMDNVKLAATTLSPAFKQVMDIVLPKVMDYYRAHQVIMMMMTMTIDLCHNGEK